MPDILIGIPHYFGGAGSSGLITIGTQYGGQKFPLRHSADIDDAEIKSVHLFDDSTPYQNTSGKDAYAVLNMTATDTEGDRIIDIYVGPTVDSLTGATLRETIDSTGLAQFDAVGDIISSKVIVIPNGNYITIRNRSGTTGFAVNLVPSFFSAVVEQAP